LLIFLSWVACVGVGALFTWLGHLHGCELNEAGEHPCVVWGVDVGSSLYMLSVGLLLLASFGLPLFVLGIVICLIVAAVQYAWCSYRRN